MNICIFNPWHDMALAYGRKPFTPPRIAISMWEEMGNLASFWADDDDIVLTIDMPTPIPDIRKAHVVPWGWDHYTRRWLLKKGVAENMMPTDDDIDILRNLSHRRTFSPLLSYLRTAEEDYKDLLVGESYYAENKPQFIDIVTRYPHGTALKAPWSSSGRGVRMMLPNKKAWFSALPWSEGILRQQGGIMIEPYYNKVTDFAMEFSCSRTGIEYRGLSLFRNSNDGSAYNGNILASEQKKREMLREYIPTKLLDNVREHISDWMTNLLREHNLPLSILHGFCFGVDMMVVEQDGEYRLHPCVEVNMRHTMGMIALKVYDDIINKGKIRYSGNDIYYEKDFTGYFSVDAASGKWSVTK